MHCMHITYEESVLNGCPMYRHPQLCRSSTECTYRVLRAAHWLRPSLQGQLNTLRYARQHCATAHCTALRSLFVISTPL